MQYLTRWVGTALPNSSLGQTGAPSSQIKNLRPTACSLPGSKKVTSENKVKHTK